MDKTFKLHYGLLILVFLMVATLPNASAFGETKEFSKGLDQKYGTITIYDWYKLPLISSMTKEITLKENTENCGQFCSNIQQYRLYKDAPLIEDRRYFRIMDDGTRILSQIRNDAFYIQVETEKTKQTIWDCGFDKVEKTKDYTQEFVEKTCKPTEKEIITPIWEKYNVGDVVKAGEYTVMHTGEKKPSWNYDWQIKTDGQWTEEWAVWGAGGGTTPYVDIWRASHTSNQVATNYSGQKILVLANITITGLGFNPSTTADTGYILNESKYILNQTTLTNGYGAITYNLIKGQSYYLVTRDDAYTNFNQYYTAVAPPYPKTSNYSHFNYTTSADGTGADWTGGTMCLFNVSYSVGSVTAGSNVTLNSPVDYFNSSSSTVTHNCSFNIIGATGVNMSLWVGTTLNQTNALTGTANSTTFSVNYADGGKNWTCRGCDSDGDCGFSTTNRTLTVDTISPTLTLISLNNVSTISLPVNATLNVTSTDLHLQNCSYKTSDNATSTIYTCNTTIGIPFATGGSKTINVSANDTFGNQNSAVYPFNIYDFVVNKTGSLTASEGTSTTFTFLINSTSFPIGDADANLFYGGTDYGASTKTVLDANSIYFTATLNLANGSGNSTGKNYEWYWSYNATYLPTYNTTFANQTVYSVSIDDCSAFDHVILNMSLKDEELNSLLNMSAGSDVEIDLDVTSLINLSELWNYHNHWVNNLTAGEFDTIAICVPDGLLNYSSYQIDFTIGYDATNHVREFYYLENGTLNNSDHFNSYTDNTIDLMDLKTADSTTFLFSFTDADGLEVDDAIIHTFRNYIGEGLFREVERSKQDTNGQTHLHLVEEDVIYYFMISQYGHIIYTSDTYNAKCLSTPCEITLSASPTETNWSIIDNEGGQYAISSDKATRVVTTDFSINSIDLVNVSLYKMINGTAILVNSTSITATAGSLELTAPLTYGNATFFIAVYRNNSFIKSAWVDMTESGKNYFGAFGVILAGLIVLSIMLMAVSEGAGFIIFTIFALIVVGVMQLVELGWMALISLICAGAIILWKLMNRRNKNG